ncbi:MAG TPA: diacylglycerol kinase family protein [Ktedonobacterales bacterium]
MTLESPSMRRDALPENSLSRLLELDEPGIVPARPTFLRSFVYAFRGLRYAFATQRNARVHALVGMGALALAFALRLSVTQIAILLATVFMVMLAELVNTGIEACVDLVSPEYHPLARVAKDVAAGAVLLAAIGASVIGLVLFAPPVLAILTHVLAR